jgi:hypothetical protein
MFNTMLNLSEKNEKRYGLKDKKVKTNKPIFYDTTNRTNSGL